MTCNSVTITQGGQVLKELVTNLTDNELLINAVVIAGSTGSPPTFVKKYQEGNNWVFQYSFSSVPSPTYVEFGAGAGLLEFIAKNKYLVALALITIGALGIVWAWRDVVSHQTEAEGKLSDNVTSTIQSCLNNPALTPEQKAACVQKALDAYISANTGTNWVMVAVILGGAVVAAAYLSGRR